MLNSFSYFIIPLSAKAAEDNFGALYYPDFRGADYCSVAQAPEILYLYN